MILAPNIQCASIGLSLMMLPMSRLIAMIISDNTSVHESVMICIGCSKKTLLKCDSCSGTRKKWIR